MGKLQKAPLFLYDYFVVMGGAEYFAQRFSEIFGARIVVGNIDSACFNDEEVRKLGLVNLDLFDKNPVAKYFKLNFGFRKFGKSEIPEDTVVLSGIHALNAAPGLKKSNKQVVYYCHTIPRFAFDLQNFYENDMGFIKALLFKVFCVYVRWDFYYCARSVDKFLCNSKNVARRIKAYTGIEATPVYPMVDTEEFQFIEYGDFYLSTARLEDHKRVDLIVKAFLKMPDKKLVVLSGGGQSDYLRELAKDAENIKFTGWTDRETIIDYMGRCIASIYIPIDEDFGISPVESMAAGKPVIGVDEGGLKETVIHGETGYLCSSEVDVEAVVDAVNTLSVEKCKTMQNACQERAKAFSAANFKVSMLDLI